MIGGCKCLKFLPLASQELFAKKWAHSPISCNVSRSLPSQWLACIGTFHLGSFWQYFVCLHAQDLHLHFASTSLLCLPQLCTCTLRHNLWLDWSCSWAAMLCMHRIITNDIPKGSGMHDQRWVDPWQDSRQMWVWVKVVWQWSCLTLFEMVFHDYLVVPFGYCNCLVLDSRWNTFLLHSGRHASRLHITGSKRRLATKDWKVWVSPGCICSRVLVVGVVLARLLQKELVFQFCLDTPCTFEFAYAKVLICLAFNMCQSRVWCIIQNIQWWKTCTIMRHGLVQMAVGIHTSGGLEQCQYHCQWLGVDEDVPE